MVKIVKKIIIKYFVLNIRSNSKEQKLPSVVNMNEFKNHFKNLKDIKSSLTQTAKEATFKSIENEATGTMNCFSTPHTLNKILSLKRSRKRSKLLTSNSSNVVGSNSAGASISLTGKKDFDLGNRFFSMKQSKLLSQALSKAKSEKIISKEKLKQMKKNSNSGDNAAGCSAVLLTNVMGPSSTTTPPSSHCPTANSSFEPSNKKFACDTDFEITKHVFNNGSSQSLNEMNVNTTASKTPVSVNSAFKELIKNKSLIIMKKKDEVDLDIKELSLLDLHSSEDDSSVVELLIKSVKTCKTYFKRYFINLC